MLVLVGSICHLVVPYSEVAQGTLLEFLMGYLPLEVMWGPSVVVALPLSVVALVEGRPCLRFRRVALGKLFPCCLDL